MVRRVTRRLAGAKGPAENREIVRETPSDVDRLAMVKWHLDRYDRLRASTVTRASVVLSAGAILSAGNALLLGQILRSPAAWLDQRGWLLGISAATLVTSLLVVSSLITAAGALLTARRSRDAFPVLRDIPVGLVFNSSDTIEKVKDFASFRAASGQSVQGWIEAAEVDLWVCIHQHRRRYRQLRLAVRFLRWAAVAFLIMLVLVLAANFVYAL